jgi:hypothetical protein
MIRQSIKPLSTTVPVELTIEDSINSVCTLVVQNVNATGYIYIGNSSVSSSNYGFMIYPSQAFTVELRPYDRIYAVASASINAVCMSIERST